jgi:hypothetical protein
MPVNVLYPRDPFNLKFYWETDWLHELFPPEAGFRHVYNPHFYENNTLIIINNPSEPDFVRLLQEYTQRNLSYGLIHLSDEYFQHNRTCYNSAKVVFRNCYTPDIKMSKVMFFPLGYKLGFWKDYKGPSPAEISMNQRKYDWTFVGGLKNDRPVMLEEMKKMSPNHYTHFNSGWNTSDSLSTREYRDIMLQTKLIPSGLGNMSIDCFRIYEALECGCIPIVVQKTPRQNFHYLEKLFGGPTPIPTVMNWKEVHQYQSLLKTADGEALRQKIYSWWGEAKNKLKAEILLRCREVFPQATWTDGVSLLTARPVAPMSQPGVPKFNIVRPFPSSLPKQGTLAPTVEMIQAYSPFAKMRGNNPMPTHLNPISNIQAIRRPMLPPNIKLATDNSTTEVPSPSPNPTASNPTASNPTASNPTASNPTASNPTAPNSMTSAESEKTGVHHIRFT